MANSSFSTHENIPRLDSPSSFAKTLSVRNTIKMALVIALVSRALVTIGSLAFRGLARSITSSTGSTPRLWAGGPSIIILIQRIYQE